MKATKFIRILSVVGIFMLLILQYIWFRNSYAIMERNVSDKTLGCIRKAVDMELYKRMESVFGFNGKKADFAFKGRKEFIIPTPSLVQAIDFNPGTQELMNSLGYPCHASSIDSVFNILIRKDLSAVPEHTLKIVEADSAAINNPPKFVFYELIHGNRYARVELIKPLGTILRDAQIVLIISLFLVIIIAIVLVYLLQSNLRENNFVQFIKDYTHALTHELKTPISSIYMASAQLTSGSLEAKPEARSRYYQMCQESSLRLLTTVDRILLVAKAEHAKINTNPVVTELKPFMERIAHNHMQNNFRKKDAEIISESVPEELTGKFDPFLMENVMNNLIDNAMKYSNQQIRIEIRADKTEKHLRIRVKDNGFGIKESEQKHIFDNFERGNKVEKKGLDGYGIGLNYVAKVIKAHRGTISVESQEGVGSEFTILLPNII